MDTDVVVFCPMAIVQSRTSNDDRNADHFRPLARRVDFSLHSNGRSSLSLPRTLVSLWNVYSRFARETLVSSRIRILVTHHCSSRSVVSPYPHLASCDCAPSSSHSLPAPLSSCRPLARLVRYAHSSHSRYSPQRNHPHLPQLFRRQRERNFTTQQRGRGE